jgi:hypothetical protein
MIRRRGTDVSGGGVCQDHPCLDCSIAPQRRTVMVLDLVFPAASFATAVTL